MRAERVRKRMNKRQKEREIVRKSDLYWISLQGTKDEQIGLTVSLSHITANSTSGVLQLSNDWPQMGSNLTLGLLLKWFPPCLDDEELTSSGTMAEWEKGQGCHRPSDRHTVVFDQGVATLSRENLKPGPGSGDRVGPGLEESPWGRVRLGRPALKLGRLFPSPFVWWKPAYKYFPVLFPGFVSVM